MEPIEVGERIRSYREQLGITREQLAAGKISSSLIKYIEQGKRKLTPIRAAIIAANLNEAAERKEIQFEITAQDLLIPEKDYAELVCKKRLSKIQENEFCLEDYLDTLKIAELYDLYDIKFEVYQKISYFYYNKNTSLSIIYLKKELSLCIRLNITDKFSDVLNRLGACYCCLGRYDLALQCFSHCYYNLKSFSGDINDMEKKVLYNLALCNKKLDNHSEALYYIEKLFSLENIETSLSNLALILRANILLALKKYEQALNIYTYIAEQSIDYLYIIQNNMAEAFNKLNRVDDSIKYLTKSINNQISSPSPNTTLSLINIAESYRHQNMIRESIVFYEYALDNSAKFNQFNELLICYEALLNLYSEIKRIDKKESLYNSLSNFTSKNKTPDEFKNKAILLLKNYK